MRVKWIYRFPKTWDGEGGGRWNGNGTRRVAKVLVVGRGEWVWARRAGGGVDRIVDAAAGLHASWWLVLLVLVLLLLLMRLLLLLLLLLRLLLLLLRGGSGGSGSHRGFSGFCVAGRRVGLGG